MRFLMRSSIRDIHILNNQKTYIFVFQYTFLYTNHRAVLKLSDNSATKEPSTDGKNMSLSNELNIPEEYLPRVFAFCQILRQELMEQRLTKRKVTRVPESLIRKSYAAAQAYAHKTFDPTKEFGDETRCGGLLLLLGDWNEPGMSTDMSIDNLQLTKQVNGKATSASLQEILAQYAHHPHSNGNDLGIFIDSVSGKVTATHVYVEGVRESALDPDPQYSGGARFTAARYFTKYNPDAVAIMVSASQGVVYLIQNGIVKESYDTNY